MKSELSDSLSCGLAQVNEREHAVHVIRDQRCGNLLGSVIRFTKCYVVVNDY